MDRFRERLIKQNIEKKLRRALNREISLLHPEPRRRPNGSFGSGVIGSLLGLILLSVFECSSAQGDQFVNLFAMGGTVRTGSRGYQLSQSPATTYGAFLTGKKIGVKFLNMKKTSKGGASASLSVDLDLGMEVGFLYTKSMDVNFRGTSLTLSAFKVPMLFWLQLNPVIWLGGGGYIFHLQPTIPSDFAQDHYGALAAVRLNIFHMSMVGLAIDARLHYGLTSAKVTDSSAFLNQVELLAGLRLGGE
jgi:hypothetical protein